MSKGEPSNDLDYGQTQRHAPPRNLDTGRTIAHLTPRGSAAEGQSPSLENDFPIGYVLDDRLVVTLKLGQGGMGTVYRVTDRETHAEYAIKVLAPELAGSPAALKELRTEVARAQPLTHQNLLSVKYFADSGPVKYVVMEHIDGEDLTAFRLRKGGRIPLSDFATIAPQILAGLDFLHERGVVHLDIKPENIMLSRAGEVKITDYGISRTIKEQLDQQARAEMPTGTLCFMSPEQLRPGTVCDRRADIYSLGMTFHLLLAGEFPFTADDRQQIVRWHIDENHSIADLGNSLLNRVIGKALAHNRDQRFTSCREFAGSLAEEAGTNFNEYLLEKLRGYTFFQCKNEPAQRHIPVLWATQEQAVEWVTQRDTTEPVMPLFALQAHDMPVRRSKTTYCLYAWSLNNEDMAKMMKQVDRFLMETELPLNAYEIKRGRLVVHELSTEAESIDQEARQLLEQLKAAGEEMAECKKRMGAASAKSDVARFQRELQQLKDIGARFEQLKSESEKLENDQVHKSQWILFLDAA